MSALKNTTNLNSPQEMQAKNVEALKVILELGQTEGNLLKGCWKDVLLCISQLDRLQLISGGVDESVVPDVSKARFIPPSITHHPSSISILSPISSEASYYENPVPHSINAPTPDLCRVPISPPSTDAA